MGPKESNVDAEIRAELSEIRRELNEAISTAMKDGFKDIHSHMSDLFNKDIDNIKSILEHYQDNHKLHFENNTNRIDDISKVRESVNEKVHAIVDDKFELLLSQIANIKEDQIKYQTQCTTTDKIEDKTDRKKNTNYGFIVMLCTVFMLMGAIIGFII